MERRSRRIAQGDGMDAGGRATQEQLPRYDSMDGGGRAASGTAAESSAGAVAGCARAVAPRIDDLFQSILSARRWISDTDAHGQTTDRRGHVLNTPTKAQPELPFIL